MLARASDNARREGDGRGLAAAKDWTGDVLRIATRGFVAAAALALTASVSPLVNATGNERTIALHNIHTKETISVVYKRDGRYVPEGLEKVNHIMRDWRRDEATRMDPALVDLLWEMHTELGSKEPIHVISGYRSRTTNDMLRRTSGGQASESRHIQGKAADVHFPDVPVKKLRYSAIVRERGGVGYYPTSAIPFVHVDTDRVRAWPRLPRHELALLFPSGQTQHAAADGGAIGSEDVRMAQVRHRDLAVEIAQFHEARQRSRAAPAILVAGAGGSGRVAETGRPRQIAAVATPEAPRLLEPPRPALRPARLAALEPEASRFTPPPASDRALLTQIAAGITETQPTPRSGVAVATARRAEPGPSSGIGGTPGPAPDLAKGEIAAEPALGQLASLPATPLAMPEPASPSDAPSVSRDSDGWIPAPAWDEEHPEELSYRPFPITPLLTATPDEPLMADLVHHDVARTLDLVDQPGAMLQLRFRPGPQMAQMPWSQQFTGAAVGIGKLEAAKAPSPSPAPTVASRAVRTSQR